MSLRSVIILFVSLVYSISAFTQRYSVLLDEGWDFRFSHQVENGSSVKIKIPHTWNAQDALSGKIDYKRGIGNYKRNLYVNPIWKGKRLFIRFEGVNSVANVFLNGKCLGEHRGGYSAFVFEITDKVNYGSNNELLVRVSNSERLDVMPLVGDFNMYGGIYRNVYLVVTEPTCISLTDYASPGVYLTQNKVNSDYADVSADVVLSNKSEACKLDVKVEVKDGLNVICNKRLNVSLDNNEEKKVKLPLRIDKPKLWDGINNPFMYRTEITIWKDNTLLDKVIQPLGLRYFAIDSEKGFFLNGNHLKLRGVCRHQDRAEIGNALLYEHHLEDAHIMLEMGANAVRLAHYQQSEDIYTLMDKMGIITWAEIPFVGPGGYLDKGFVDTPDFRSNGKQQLVELIRQNYNHPSICFWGLFNELKEEGDNPIGYINELKVLAHQEDKTRPTTSASNQNGNINLITDCIAWNRYDGWYSNTPKSLAVFLDKTHEQNPNLKIGISEYGAGASIYHHQDTLLQPKPVSYWHPENWQTYYHMENWKIINERPFVWGSFIWNLFDFGAAHRHEGDRPGINDKGLVTFDRKNRKDAFYFYKANWNPENMIHIAGKRCVNRSGDKQDIMVFTNVDNVELYVNNKLTGKANPDKYSTIVWKNVKLNKGENHILVKSTSLNERIFDECTLIFE